MNKKFYIVFYPNFINDNTDEYKVAKKTFKKMKLKELKKGEIFKPDLGPYKGKWEPPKWRKVEYNKKKRKWYCEEIDGKRTAYFNTNTIIEEV